MTVFLLIKFPISLQVKILSLCSTDKAFTNKHLHGCVICVYVTEETFVIITSWILKKKWFLFIHCFVILCTVYVSLGQVAAAHVYRLYLHLLHSCDCLMCNKLCIPYKSTVFYFVMLGHILYVCVFRGFSKSQEGRTLKNQYYISPYCCLQNQIFFRWGNIPPISATTWFMITYHRVCQSHQVWGCWS